MKTGKEISAIFIDLINSMPEGADVNKYNHFYLSKKHRLKKINVPNNYHIHFMNPDFISEETIILGTNIYI